MIRRSSSNVSLLVLLVLLVLLAQTITHPVMAASVFPVATGLMRPVYMTAPAGDVQRLFIVEQFNTPPGTFGTASRIRILNHREGRLDPTPFLTIPDLSSCRDCGLLGMAFHPNYEQNGYFYVNEMHSRRNAPPWGGLQNVIRRYQVSPNDPNVALAGSGRTILTLDQPARVHNADWMGFGPYGYLYITTGDGFSNVNQGATGVSDAGQDITDQLLGKVLRLDVGSDGQADDFPGDPDRN